MLLCTLPLTVLPRTLTAACSRYQRGSACASVVLRLICPSLQSKLEALKSKETIEMAKTIAISAHCELQPLSESMDLHLRSVEVGVNVEV